MTQTIPADWDSGWKDSLSKLLPWFLAFFFPKVHADIDWSRGFEALDKELQKIAPDSATGRRAVDMLFKVWRRSGEERWVLIHIEVQSQKVPGFPKRVHWYHFRAEDFYRLQVASFVVLADDDAGWRPEPYTYDLWGCSGEFRYPTVKLLDYADRIEELEKSDNPFAVVVLAHLKARETAGDRDRRMEWKIRLLKGLYNRGWERDDVRQLLRTIDWFLTLSRPDNRLVRTAIEADEPEKTMPYISSFEEMAMEEGESRGEVRGLKNGIAVALKIKFGEGAAQLIAEVQQINDLEKLHRINDSIVEAATPADLRRAWSE